MGIRLVPRGVPLHDGVYVGELHAARGHPIVVGLATVRVGVGVGVGVRVRVRVRVRVGVGVRVRVRARVRVVESVCTLVTSS